MKKNRAILKFAHKAAKFPVIQGLGTFTFMKQGSGLFIKGYNVVA